MSAPFLRRSFLPFSLCFSSSSRTGMDGGLATMWKSFSHSSLLLFSPGFSSSSVTRMDGGLATMSTSFSRRSLLFSSLRFSSSSRTPSPYALRTSHFLSSCNSSSHAFPRVVGNDNVRVSVWWNSDICALPAGVNVGYVLPMLAAFIKTYGINVGHVQCYAFGDIVRLSRENGDDLRCPWIYFIDVPEVRRQPNRTEKIILWEVVKWVEKNPPPAFLFFTPTDPYLDILLEELRIRGYDVLVAGQDTLDYSSDSCDDQDEMTMEDLFALDKIRPVTVDLLSDSDCAPKSVLKQIQRILKSHPDGILLESLRRELVKDDWKFSKKYYDILLFGRLLLLFPKTLQLEARVDGIFVTSV